MTVSRASLIEVEEYGAATAYLALFPPSVARNPAFVQLEPVSSEGSYQGGGTLGGKLGCALAALVGLPLIGAALIYASMGDCPPGAECIAGWKMIAGAAVIAGLAGAGARAAINAFARRRRGGS